MTPDETALLQRVAPYIQAADLPIDKTGFTQKAQAYIDVLLDADRQIRSLDAFKDARFTPALSETGLIAGLAVILDRFLAYVIAWEISKGQVKFATAADFVAYLEAKIAPRRQELRNTYPMLADALARASTNHVANLTKLLLCLTTDWDRLNQVFNQRLLTLESVRSTGSDFHKGGQQTLILTFGRGQTSATWRLVYKPTDLELDYRIAGDTSVSQAAGLQAGRSLFEILNTLETNAAYRLPTYRIFPAVRGSASADIKTAIEKAYGYLEFIEYSPNATDAECLAFYHLMGRLAGVASTLAMRDVNQENVIVSNAKPVLIDMEASLVAGPTSVKGTGLFGNLEKGTASPRVYRFDNGTFGPIARTEQTKNVLRDPQNRALSVVPYYRHLTAGYCAMLDLLSRAQQPVAEWLNAIRGVTARNVPLATTQFAEWLEPIYRPHLYQNAEVVTVAAAIDAYQKDRSARYQDNVIIWKNVMKINAWALPGFWSADYATTDFQHLDIPSFYGRPTNAQLYDARGSEVGPRPNFVQPRTTYFSAAPIVELTNQLTPATLAAKRITAVADLANALTTPANSVATLMGQLALPPAK